MMANPDAAPISSTETGRGWALDNADATDRIKPRRPYTPYNLFYLLERELVVQGGGPSSVKEMAIEKESMVAELGGKRPEDDIPIPSRYKNVVLLPKWYEPNLKEKRKHRKTHGKVSVLRSIFHRSDLSRIKPHCKPYSFSIDTRSLSRTSLKLSPKIGQRLMRRPRNTARACRT